ncbi:MAG: rhodanese-like domain-containing protein [Desulfobulbaceae bacterium]|nr:rhodanese-like domain-containing protein [Desulfobulbaceae bacterium]
MKQNYFNIGFSILLLLLLTACDSNSQKNEQHTPATQTSSPAQTALASPPPAPQSKIFRTITPKEAQAMLQKRKDIIFLDVRTPQERAQAAIAGSQLVSFWDIAQNKIPLPKDKPIMLVCAVGGRSYGAGQILSKRGYQEVYNLKGGIEEWYREGLPITRGN